jgi:hypothetical protein
MPVKVGYIVKTALETNYLSSHFIFDQKPARLTDPDLHQKVIVGLFGHQFEIPAKRSNTQICDGSYVLQ